jgi:hypothetical protein
MRHFSYWQFRTTSRCRFRVNLIKTLQCPARLHCIFPEPDATCNLLICFEAGPDSAGQGGFKMKIDNSGVSITHWRQSFFAMGTLALAVFPVTAGAQQDPINGAIGGAAQGTYEGKTAAGPVGGLVGGALGAGVGAVAGTLNVIGNGVSQAVQPMAVPPPPGDGPRGSYDSNGNWRPN